MRKHTWIIKLSQREIPGIVRNAFPDNQMLGPNADGTGRLHFTTYDPITDAQEALLMAEQLSAQGIRSVSCSSEEVDAPSPLAMAPQEAPSSDEYLYTFTLRGHIVVKEPDGEDIAYGWTKTALEVDLALDPAVQLQKQVRDFEISSVDLFLEENNSENEV